MNRVSPAEDTIWKQKKNTNIADNFSLSFLQTMFLQLCKISWTALADIWYILVVKLLWIVLIFYAVWFMILEDFLFYCHDSPRNWSAYQWLKIIELISQTLVINFGESFTQCFFQYTWFFVSLCFAYFNININFEVSKF